MQARGIAWVGACLAMEAMPQRLVGVEIEFIDPFLDDGMVGGK